MESGLPSEWKFYTLTFTFTFTRPALRPGAELISIGFAAFEAGGDFHVIAIGQRGFEAVELVFEEPQGAQDFIAILLKNAPPDLRVARRDPGRIAEPATRKVAPCRVFLGQTGAKAGGNGLW